MTEPEHISWLRIIFAFSIVSGLLGLLAYGLKYISQNQIRIPGFKTATRRLAIIENLPIDARRRLVIVRRDHIEHLLLLGIDHDIVVEANLTIPDNTGSATKGPG